MDPTTFFCFFYVAFLLLSPSLRFVTFFLLAHNYTEQWALDSGGWKAALAANASVTVGGLLDGVHSLSLKHDYTADGRSETESVGYT